MFGVGYNQSPLEAYITWVPKISMGQGLVTSQTGPTNAKTAKLATFTLG